MVRKPKVTIKWDQRAINRTIDKVVAQEQAGQRGTPGRTSQCS